MMAAAMFGSRYVMRQAMCFSSTVRTALHCTALLRNGFNECLCSIGHASRRPVATPSLPDEGRALTECHSAGEEGRILTHGTTRCTSAGSFRLLQCTRDPPKPALACPPPLCEACAGQRTVERFHLLSLCQTRHPSELKRRLKGP